METMTIRLKDGKTFTGTPLEIVRQMQALAFAAAGLDVAGYCTFVVENARKFDGVELFVTGDSDEERAASLVEELLATGLAEVVG